MPFEFLCACGRRLTVTAGDAGATVRCECDRAVPVPDLHALRASADEVTGPPSAPLHGQLTGVDLAVCVLLPVIGLIAGVLRLIRGEPTAGRMLLVSGTVLLLIILLQYGTIFGSFE